MRNRFLTPILFASVGSLVILSVGFTYGAYVKYAQANQEIGVYGARYIYFKPTEIWDLDNATETYFMYCCNSTNNPQTNAVWIGYSGTIGSGRSNTIYYFTTPDPSSNYANIVFVRANSTYTTSTITFDNMWGQTVDLTYGDSEDRTKILFTITKNGYKSGNTNVKAEGVWSAYSNPS